MNIIKIKYHNQNLEKLHRLAIGDWIDLRAAECVSLAPWESGLISLGISMKLPEGYEAWVAPRSSTFKNWGILQTNSIGIIDNAYSGENDIWRLPVLAVRATTIREGDRICQFRILPKMQEVSFEEVAFMADEDRGGFGSSGKR